MFYTKSMIFLLIVALQLSANQNPENLIAAQQNQKLIKAQFKLQYNNIYVNPDSQFKIFVDAENFNCDDNNYDQFTWYFHQYDKTKAGQTTMDFRRSRSQNRPRNLYNSPIQSSSISKRKNIYDTGSMDLKKPFLKKVVQHRYENLISDKTGLPTCRLWVDFSSTFVPLKNTGLNFETYILEGQYYREVRYMCPKVRLSKSILDQENEKMSTLALLSILGDFWF